MWSAKTFQTKWIAGLINPNPEYQRPETDELVQGGTGSDWQRGLVSDVIQLHPFQKIHLRQITKGKILIWEIVDGGHRTRAIMGFFSDCVKTNEGLVIFGEDGTQYDIGDMFWSEIITEYPELREAMGTAAVKAAEYIKYEGAGTVEFLVDKHRNFYFMEMNTRIQVEHPITEQVVDYDLIREQIMVAAGIPISGKNYFPQLHAIECRINAEDPYNDFRPSPGKITVLHSPGGHGVRLDTHVYAGYTIPPNYDSMIAKLITTAQTRQEAINKMKRALDEFHIEGIKTTIPFHRQLMDHPDYVSGNYTTAFMDTWVMDAKIEE